MTKSSVTIGKITEGFVTLNIEGEHYEFYNLLGTLKETVTRFCENNATSTYNKAQQTSYYMSTEKVELVLKTLQAEELNQLAVTKGTKNDL